MNNKQLEHVARRRIRDGIFTRSRSGSLFLKMESERVKLDVCQEGTKKDFILYTDLEQLWDMLTEEQ